MNTVSNSDTESKPSKPSPYTLTQFRLGRLLGHLRRGLTLTQALKATGIGRTAYANWLLADPTISEQVEVARERSRSLALSVIQRAARDGDWKAAAEFLKLAHGMGKADQSVQSTVNVGVAVTPTLTEADRMELIAQRERSSEHKALEDDAPVMSEPIAAEQVTDNIEQ